MTLPTQEIRDSRASSILLIWSFAIAWNLFIGVIIWLVRPIRKWPESALLGGRYQPQIGHG